MWPGFASGRRQAHGELWMEPVGCGVLWCFSSPLESAWLLPSVQDEVVMATDSRLFSSPVLHSTPTLPQLFAESQRQLLSHTCPYAPISHSPHLQLPRWGPAGLIWQLAESSLHAAPRSSDSFGF